MIEKFENKCGLNSFEIIANIESIKYIDDQMDPKNLIDDSEEIPEPIMIHDDHNYEGTKEYISVNDSVINFCDSSQISSNLN